MKPPVPLLEPDWIRNLSLGSVDQLPDDVAVLRRIVHDLMSLARQQHLERRQLQQQTEMVERWLGQQTAPSAKRKRKRRRH